jgi:hypothetical protein
MSDRASALINEVIEETGVPQLRSFKELAESF